MKFKGDIKMKKLLIILTTILSIILISITLSLSFNTSTLSTDQLSQTTTTNSKQQEIISPMNYQSTKQQSHTYTGTLTGNGTTSNIAIEINNRIENFVIDNEGIDNYYQGTYTKQITFDRELTQENLDTATIINIS
jgi:hypothetical protein